MMTALHPRGVNHLALSTRDMKDPVAFERPAEPVPQPATDPSKPAMMYPNPSTGEMIMSISDEDTWDRFSEAIPPVIVG